MEYKGEEGKPRKIFLDSQLQNEVASLERQVLEAKKAALQKQLQTLTVANPAPTEEPTANPREVRNPNIRLFYEHEEQVQTRKYYEAQYQRKTHK